MKRFKKATSTFLVCSILSLALPMQQTHAAMVGTELVLAQAESDALRHRVHEFISRADVATEMQKLGVDEASAKLRVAALTDSELQQVAGKLDTMPAGGESILGVVFTVFIILLITDILGFTKVFPFTKPIR
jgi:hypothetical protein